MSSDRPTSGLDRFPRWRKPRPDPRDRWPVSSQQAAAINAIVGQVQERRQPGLVIRFTTHRKLYVACFLLARVFNVGPSRVGRRLKISRARAGLAIKGGLPILREYLTQDQIDELADWLASGAKDNEGVPR